MRARRAAEDAAAAAAKALDKVDAMKPRTGRVDLFGFLRGDQAGGVAGGGLEYAHRLSPGASAFARGAAGVAWDPYGRSPYYEGLAGLRVRF